MHTLTNTLVVASLTGSIILIATKHHLWSLITSIFATVIIIATMIPSEEVKDEVFHYSPGGGVTLVPPKKNKTEKNKTKKKRVSRVADAQTPTNNLPACANPPPPPSDREMRDHIRNNGLYGIHGDLSCKLLQRGTVADTGMLQPLNARNQMLKFLSVEQLHAKDPHLIPRKTKQ